MTAGVGKEWLDRDRQGNPAVSAPPGSDEIMALGSLDAVRARMLATPWGLDGSPSEEARELLKAIIDPDVFLAPTLQDTHPRLRKQAEAYVLEQAMARHIVFEAGCRASNGETLTANESGFAHALVASMRGQR